MTISDNYVPIKALGNGVTTNYSGSWQIIALGYEVVELQDAVTGVFTPQVRGTHYSLVFDATGFTVTFLAGHIPTAASYVVISRNVAKEQQDPYKTSTGFQGDVVENSLDQIVAIAQDLQEDLDRAPQFPVGTDTSVIQAVLPLPVDQNVPVWSGTSGKMINMPINNITIVAAAIANVNTVATNIAAVNTVATNLTGANTIGTVSAAIANVNAVGTNIANVNAAAANATNINAAVSNAANINTVAGISASVTACAGIAAAITAVNSNSTNINAVNANSANINAVNANSANINTVAAAAANINTVAAAIANVNTNATNIASINTNATNIVAIQNAASNAAIASAAAAAALSAVSAMANEWQFAVSAVMADPGTGFFRLNNASFASVTQIALSALTADSGNPNLRTFLQTWDASTHNPKGILRIFKNSTNFIILGISGAKIDNTTWLQYPVTVIASAGSFAASDATEIGFTPYGNDGTGTGTVTTTGTPSSGNLAKFSGASSIVNGDLSGHITTSGTLVTTISAGVVTEAMQNLTDVTTGNVSTAQHGYQKKLSNNSYEYADGKGNYSIPSQIPQNSQSANYTTVLADAGKDIFHPTADNNPRTFTIDSNANVAYPVGTVITFTNMINTLSIAITTDTLTLSPGGTTGTRTLAANGQATAKKIAATQWLIAGTGLT